MSTPRPGSPTLVDLVDIARALHADKREQAGLRERRDRAIGRRLAGVAADPPERALAWLAERRRDGSLAQESSAGGVHLIVGALLVLGALAGWGATTGTFFYDGSGRVNVMAVLAVFVVAQGCTLLAFALAALPRRVLGAVPGSAALSGALQWLAPGRLALLLTRLLPQEARRAVQAASGDARRHHGVYAEVYRWGVLSASQTLALAFNLAAILTALALVVFTDLAFGWATTLQVDAAQMHAFVSALAAPWSGFLPGAVPSTELVAASRYYRLGGAATHVTDRALLAMLGAWWPFLLACMGCYGLAPRLLTLAWARRRLRLAVRAALLRAPEVRALCERMQHPLVETCADVAADPVAVADARDSDITQVPWARLRGPFAVVDWAGVPGGAAALSRYLGERLAAPVAAVHAAGGGHELEADERTVAALAAGTACTVVVACKAWEPPLLELQDFLATLRRALGQERDLLLAPLALADGALAPPGAEALQAWRHVVRVGGDPHLYLLAAAGDTVP